METTMHVWLTYMGLCALFMSKAYVTAPWQYGLLMLAGVPFSYWSLMGVSSAQTANTAATKEGFSGVRIVRESGKPCLLREKGITYKGCYYTDVGGCAIPEEGLQGDCPANYDDFRRKYGGPEARTITSPAPAPAVKPTSSSEKDHGECTEDTWVKMVSLRDDEVEDLTLKGKNPLAACLQNRSGMVRRMRDRFLYDLQHADNTQEICTRIRRDELKASNKIARQMFREVYQECFRDVEPASQATSHSSAPRIKTSGFVLMDEPEMLTIDKNGRESDDVLRRHMRQEFVSKCQRFVSQKTPEQVQAFIELGEKVENLEWWRNVSLMVERTADEIRKAQLLSGRT